MNPILYTADETEFETNGLGMLADAVRCTVRQERTGVFELEMEYPVDGMHFGDLCLRRIVLARPDNLSRPQPFRIHQCSKPLGGIVTICARHIAYDLMGIPVKPFTAGSAPAAMVGLGQNAVVDCPFEFWTDKTTQANMTIMEPSPIWSLLGGSSGGILDVYGGEYEFDRWTVKLHQQRGHDRGVTIRYGKNLTSLKQEESCAGVYTGMYPYWTDAEGTLVELDGKIVNASGSYDFTRILTKDFSEEWQEPPTQETLRTRAERYMKENQIGIPDVNLDVSFVQLEQTEEYKQLKLLEQVGLCDTVTVEFPKLGVSAKAKCITVVFDVLNERYEKLEIGDAKSTFASALTDQGKALQKATSLSFLRKAVDRATNWIVNGRGYMVAIKNAAGQWEEICSLDDPDLTQAVNVWRWNNGGFGHSPNGYNGPYSVAITQDGHIVADFIDTGTMTANIIRAGVLTDAADKNYWNMETGEFKLSAAANISEAMNQQNTVNALTDNGAYQGIWLSDGRLYFNGDYIRAGTIEAETVAMSGKFRVYNGRDGVLGGYLGYVQGSTITQTTDGIGITDATGECWAVATNEGVRMQAGNTQMYIHRADGNVYIKGGNLVVSGSVTEHAEYQEG